MFPADSLNPQYIEEQAAKYAAKRLAQAQATANMQAASFAASANSTPVATRPNTPANFPANKNSGLLGNIFQGFVKATAYDYQELGSRSTATTPGCEKSELEALIAEKKRDADICSMPTW